MGRKRSSPVETKYQPPREPPQRGRRKSTPPPRREKRPISKLADYLDDNADTGLTRAELVEQFQDYDCPHNDNPRLFKLTITKPDGTQIFNCEVCRKEKRTTPRAR